MSKMILTLIVVVATFPAFAGDLAVRLALWPSDTLPGVPVTVAVTVVNTSELPVAFSSQTLQFNATSPKGEALDSSVHIPVQPWYGESEKPTKYVLASGDTKVLFFNPGRDFQSPLFNEMQLYDPGEYDLSVTVKGSGGRTATSNLTHLRINAPLGDDLVVWKDLNASGNDPGGLAISTPLACPLIMKYPHSQYYRLMSAFCLFRELERSGESPEKYVSAVLQAAVTIPPQAQDALRFELGQQFVAAAQSASHHNKQQEAARISALGAAFAARFMDEASTQFGAVGGAWLKTQFHTENEWREQWTSDHRGMQPERAVMPFVSCVTVHTDGTFSVEFGYDNPNDHLVKRVVGNRNAIRSESTESSVPTDFRPGRTESAFTVNGGKGEVTWVLDGKSVTASPSTAQRCSDLAVPE